MSTASDKDAVVAVLIAAYNAADTIGTAVKSALSQPETAELVVIDDASSDRTVEVAEAAAGGDPRFKAIKQAFNQGPSAARNRGIDATTAPILMVLDSDDVFLPGRLAAITAQEDWDLCADNVWFTDDRETLSSGPPAHTSGARICDLDLATFVEENIGARHRVRSELGFLKPAFRRDFLTKHGLRFDETCRLGEDFVLYAQMLAHGARYRLLERCGYAALVRNDSLSAQHSVTHLRAFLRGTRAIEALPNLSDAERRVLSRHARHIEDKVRHREVLETRHYEGLWPAIGSLVSKPTALRDILYDRLQVSRPVSQASRLMISAEDFTRLSA
ncbi:MAG: glycosyltransferase family 2 protein [Pseudomonadota bacterium]